MWRPSCLYRSCSVSRTCSTRRMRMIPLSSRRTRPSSTRDQICPLPLQRLTDLFLDLTCNLQERQSGIREARQAAGEGLHSEIKGRTRAMLSIRAFAIGFLLYLGCTRKAPRIPGLYSLSSILSPSCCAMWQAFHRFTRNCSHASEKRSRGPRLACSKFRLYHYTTSSIGGHGGASLSPRISSANGQIWSHVGSSSNRAHKLTLCAVSDRIHVRQCWWPVQSAWIKRMWSAARRVGSVVRWRRSEESEACGRISARDLGGQPTICRQRVHRSREVSDVPTSTVRVKASTPRWRRSRSSSPSSRHHSSPLPSLPFKTLLPSKMDVACLIYSGSTTTETL